MAIYDKGDSVRLTATFTSDSVNTDPTDTTADVVFTWRRPSGKDTAGTAGTDSTPSPTRSATGIYYTDLVLDEVGVHSVQVKGLEGVVAADIIELQVAKSVFA